MIRGYTEHVIGNIKVFIMSDFDSTAFMARMQNICPPVLEAIAMTKSADDDRIGLSPEGRTVRWMRSVQNVFAGIFASVGGIIGMAVGTVCGLVKALAAREVRMIEDTAGAFMNCGMEAGIAAGTVIGSVASIAVTPFAAAANLFEHCLRQARRPPRPPEAIPLVPVAARPA